MSRLKSDLVLVLGLLLLAAAVGLWLHGPPDRLPPLPDGSRPGAALDRAEFRSFVTEKRGLVLDARKDAEYREGHVPGAISLPIEDFAARYAALKPLLEPNQQRPIVVYCSNYFCQRSRMVQKNLQALGYSRVAVYPSGWSGWRDAGLPAEKTE